MSHPLRYSYLPDFEIIGEDGLLFTCHTPMRPDGSHLLSYSPLKAYASHRQGHKGSGAPIMGEEQQDVALVLEPGSTRYPEELTRLYFAVIQATEFRVGSYTREVSQGRGTTESPQGDEMGYRVSLIYIPADPYWRDPSGEPIINPFPN